MKGSNPHVVLTQLSHHEYIWTVPKRPSSPSAMWGFTDGISLEYWEGTIETPDIQLNQEVTLSGNLTICLHYTDRIFLFKIPLNI